MAPRGFFQPERVGAQARAGGEKLARSSTCRLASTQRRGSKKTVRQGRSEVRDAKKNERHVCGQARMGERPVSQRRVVPPQHGEPLRDARTPLADFFRTLLEAGDTGEVEVVDPHGGHQGLSGF
jgi:hypothetical protein